MFVLYLKKKKFKLFQVVRSAVTSGAGSTTSGVVSGSLGSREINYILRVLGPAACRNPEVFTETANSCVRIALPAPRGAGTGTRQNQPCRYELKKPVSTRFCSVCLFMSRKSLELCSCVHICCWGRFYVYFC